MGGFHAYYTKDDIKVGLVTDCDSVMVFEIHNSTTYVCKEYIVDDPNNLIKKLSNDYEEHGFVEAEWMFGNSSFWDIYYAQPRETIEM